MTRSAQPSLRRGSTLAELLVSIVIVGTVLLALMAMFGSTFSTAKRSRADSVSSYIVQQLRTRLLTNPDWPPGTADEPLSGEMKKDGTPRDVLIYDQLFFDGEGIEVSADEETRHVYQAEVRISRSPNYNSPRLDYVVIQVLPVQGNIIEPVSFTLQRARSQPRPEP